MSVPFVVRHLAGHWNILPDGRKEDKIDRVLALLEENNLMLKRLVDKLDTVESEDYQTKRTLDEFVNNVVSNWFADKVLDMKGGGRDYTNGSY